MFRRHLAGTATSNLADGVFQTALPLVTLGVTRDAAAFATVTFAMRVPWLLFALPAGVIADRLDRRRTMLLVNLVRAALVGGLAVAVAAGGQSLWLLCAVALALGAGETLYDTAAQSIVPNLVGAAELTRANSRLYLVELTMQKFVGPPLGGLLVGVAAAGALAGSAAAYVASAVALGLVAGAFRPVGGDRPRRLFAEVAEGVRYLYRHRLLRSLAVLAGMANLTSTAVLAVLPLYAVRPGPLGLSAAGFGVLLTAEAAGAVVGSLAANRLVRACGNARAVGVAWLVLIVAIGARPLGDSVWVVAVTLAAEGAAFVAWNVVTVSLRQRIAPDHLLGRVNSGYRLLAWGAMPLGAMLGGVAGGLYGVRVVFVVAAAGLVAAVPLLVAIRAELRLAEVSRRG